MSLLKRIGGKIDKKCLVTGGLNKEGCKLAMTGMPASRMVVDFDKPGSPLAKNATRCDYLLVAAVKGKDVVAVLELKSGALDADQVIKQLQAGASAAERIVPQDGAFRFRPIAAVGGNHNKYQRRMLKERSNKNKIKFHGCKQVVRLIRCGIKLAPELDQ